MYLSICAALFYRQDSYLAGAYITLHYGCSAPSKRGQQAILLTLSVFCASWNDIVQLHFVFYYRMASTIVQVFLKEILEAYFNSQTQVRIAAVSVLHLILKQGLIHPVQVLVHCMVLFRFRSTNVASIRKSICINVWAAVECPSLYTQIYTSRLCNCLC